MPNNKCPDCGKKFDPKTFQKEQQGNRVFFICPDEHRNEIGKTENNGWEFKYAYPFKPLKTNDNYKNQ